MQKTERERERTSERNEHIDVDRTSYKAIYMAWMDNDGYIPRSGVLDLCELSESLCGHIHSVRCGVAYVRKCSSKQKNNYCFTARGPRHFHLPNCDKLGEKL